MADCTIIYVPPSGTTQHTQHGWIATIGDVCVGHIRMQQEANKQIKFMDAWVHEDYRRQGIFRTLWDARWKFVTKGYDGYTAYAWAKPMSLPLLLEKGFEEGDACIYVEKEITHTDYEVPFTFVSC